MLDYRLWQGRLHDEIGDDVKKVGYATDVQSVLKNAVKNSPSIFVIPKDEKATNRDTTARTRSMMTGGIDVLMIAADFSDALGGKAIDGLHELRKKIFNVLVGWTPADADLPVHFRSGKRMAMHKGLLIWADTYDCQFLRGQQL